MSDVRKMISGSLKNIERKLVSDHGVHLLLPPPSPLSAAWDGGGGGGWATYQILKNGAWQDLNF